MSIRMFIFAKLLGVGPVYLGMIGTIALRPKAIIFNFKAFGSFEIFNSCPSDSFADCTEDGFDDFKAFDNVNTLELHNSFFFNIFECAMTVVVLFFVLFFNVPEERIF